MIRWSEYVNQRLDEMLERSQSAEYKSGAMDWYPTDGTINFARSVIGEYLRDTTPTPSVVPGEDQTVAFVWHKNGWDVELEISDNGTDPWVWARCGDRIISGYMHEVKRDWSEVLDALEA